MRAAEFIHFLRETLDDECAVFNSQNAPPGEAAAKQLAADFQASLPVEYVALQSVYGGTYIEAKEAFWPRPKAYQAGPYWSFLYACAIFGIGEDVPQMLDIRHQAKAFEHDFGQHVPFRLIPLFRWIGSADRLCTDTHGRLFEVSHEDPANPIPVEEDFLSYVAKQVQTLVANKSRLKTEVPAIFKTEVDRLEERRAQASKDANLTSRRCPECNSPCPSYRSTCKVCGFAIGKSTV